MPALLRLQLTRRPDGSTIFRVLRADGSATWQHHQGSQAGFFPIHDLTHYAVESELALSTGFYGLLLAGWDVTDTTGKGARGALPGETIVVEHLVGLMTLERAGSAAWTAETLQRELCDFARARGLPAPPRFTDDQLARVRERMLELHRRWGALEPGQTLDLEFP